jgi:hypothetical protein
MQTVPVLLMPGDTIAGHIKKVNQYQLSSIEVDELLQFVAKENKEVLRPGMVIQIPVKNEGTR